MRARQPQERQRGDEVRVAQHGERLRAVAVDGPAEERAEQQVRGAEGKEEEAGGERVEVVAGGGDEWDCGVEGAEEEGLD